MSRIAVASKDFMIAKPWREEVEACHSLFMLRKYSSNSFCALQMDVPGGIGRVENLDFSQTVSIQFLIVWVLEMLTLYTHSIIQAASWVSLDEPSV